MCKTGWAYVVGGAVAMFFAAQVAMADGVNVLTFDQLGVIPASVGEPILNF